MLYEKLMGVRERRGELGEKLSPLPAFYLLQVTPSAKARCDLAMSLWSNPDFKDWDALGLAMAQLEAYCKNAGLLDNSLDTINQN